MLLIRQTLLKMDSSEAFVRFAAIVIGIAIIARFSVLFLFWAGWPWHQGGVADGWNLLAINLMDFGTFGFSPGESTITRGPIFPLVELPLYWAFGENYAFWSASLLLLDAFTCILLMCLLKRLWGARPALLAGIFYALHVPLIHYTAKISQFTSITPLVCLWFYLFSLWNSDANRRWLPFALGVVSGFLVLNKTVYLPAPFVGVVALLWCYRLSPYLGKKFIPEAAVYLLVTAAVIAPWTFRNYVVTEGKIVPVQSLFWGIVWQDIMFSEIDAIKGRSRPDGEALEYLTTKFWEMIEKGDKRLHAQLRGPKKELYEEQLYSAAAKDWIKNNPGRYAINIANNIWQFWARAENLKKTLQFASLQIIFLGATFIGFWSLLISQQLHQVKYGLLLILMVWLEHLPVIGWGRHSLDLVPILAAVFGLGLSTWLRQSSDVGLLPAVEGQIATQNGAHGRY